ncbi:hypothetical protein [Prosthecobacter dejongeii]|uniref:Uncharacterized protein n=1 Tax=Prosthecobacter dejongeii TaxID=48465 RepID=A0A7W7YMK4_9BACT|nr:hypothetical protein [Prosthecobacter dejongeii]MBB5038978.1 hypothetical protein [Prosthecobacter dejongeii]
MENKTYSLPEFTLQTRVTPTKAKHDKLEFTMPLGIFRHHTGDAKLGEIEQYMGAPPKGTRTPENWDQARHFSTFLTRPQGSPNSPQRLLNVRKKPITGLDFDPRFNSIPLFSGRLELEERGHSGRRIVTAVYQANVNPTRFTRYQDWNKLRLYHRPSGLPTLFRDTHIPSSEFPLDGSDNWLPDNPALIWQSFMIRWPDRLRDYFNDLESTMRQEVENRGRLSLDGTGFLYFEPSEEAWHMRRVEVYWEFKNASSPEFLNSLDRAMRSYSALEHSRQEFVGDEAQSPRQNRDRETFNTTVLSVTVMPGVRIVIYPKTNERLRMEVRFNVADFSPRSELPSEASGSAGMVEALQRYSETAADVLNTFLAHLEGQMNPGFIPWSPPPTDLMFRIIGHCQNREAARVIMALLIQEGAVSRVKWLKTSIDGLVKSGILERAKNQQGPQSVTFVPSPAYLMAVQRLRDATTADALIMDRRCRRDVPQLRR